MGLLKNLLLEQELLEGENDLEFTPPEKLTCLYCNSHNLTEKLEPLSSKYYSKIYCGDCDRFVKFGRNPVITKATEIRNDKIQSILEDYDINAQELQFLKSVLKKRFLTIPQRKWLDKIGSKYIHQSFDWSAYTER